MARSTRMAAVWLAIVAFVVGACGGQPSASPGGAASAAPTAAATQAVYKSGDKVTIVVPYKAGGGFDIYSRTLQPYLEKALKQLTGADVSVLVQNVDGANGQLAVEQVYRAAGDGKTVVMAGLDIAVGQQVVNGAKFDLNKMTPLAQITEVSRGVLIRPGVLQDVSTGFKGLIARSKIKPVLWGAQGAEQSDTLLFATLKEAGFEIKVDRVAFQGEADAVTALLRNDLEAYEVSLPSAVKIANTNPTLKLLLSFGLTRVPYAKDTPTLLEQGIGGAEKIAKTAGASIRILLAPPGVPAATAKVLEQAFGIAENDKDFLAASDKAGNPVTYSDAASVRKLIDTNIALYEANKAILK